MTLNSTGLGIGASPSYKLHSVSSSAGATTYPVVVDNAAGGAGVNIAGIGFASGGSLKSSITSAVYGNDFLAFNVGGSGTTERLRIDSSGNVGVGVTPSAGNGAIQLSAGVGFPATQVASANANTLDDYEEGTWTPVFQGTVTVGTYVYSTQVGRYTKVGNLVTVFGHLLISSITTAATGVMRIGGLPFTTSSVDVYAAATVGYTDLITISSGTLALSVNTGGVVIDMYRIISGAGIGFITPSDLVANTRINFTATYFV